MPDPIVRPARAFRGTPIQFLDLLLDLDQVPVTMSDVASFDLRIFDEGHPDTPLVKAVEKEADPLGHVFDTLQTDHGWSQQGGWNFRYVLSGANTRRLAGGGTYRFEFRFNMATGQDGPLFLVYSITFEPVMTDPTELR